jgi:hypothetical protein
MRKGVLCYPVLQYLDRLNKLSEAAEAVKLVNLKDLDDYGCWLLLTANYYNQSPLAGCHPAQKHASLQKAESKYHHRPDSSRRSGT